jgi:curved DNA-binding protein CbpA
MEEGDDPYEILGVSSLATEQEIKKSYRKLALKHHPDKCQDPAEKDAASNKFAQIAGAYEILTDASLRRKYNESQSGYDSASKKPGTASSNSGAGGGGTPSKKAGFHAKNFGPKFHFNDPYEVFKRDFEEDFGIPYPGMYDVVLVVKYSM